MRKIIAGIVVALTLSGCATFGQMEDGLNGLVGQPLDAAVARIGFPSSERNVAGMRIVEWGRSNSAMIAMPTTATTTGYTSSGPFSATTNSTTPVLLNYRCHIALQVDANNIITRYQYEGNLGGCAPYIRALKRS